MTPEERCEEARAELRREFEATLIPHQERFRDLLERGKIIRSVGRLALGYAHAVSRTVTLAMNPESGEEEPILTDSEAE